MWFREGWVTRGTGERCGISVLCRPQHMATKWRGLILNIRQVVAHGGHPHLVEDKSR